MKRVASLALVLLVSACSSPSPAPHPSPAAVLPSPVALPAPPDPGSEGFGPFSNADVVIPAWPKASTQCVSGRVHISPAGQFVPSQQGKTVVNIMMVVPVDFDRDGTDEYAVYVMCGEGPESGGRMVVGYRKALEPIGRIVGTQDGFAMMDYMHRKGNGVEVLVSREYSDGGQQSASSEWRTYELSGKAFHQVGNAARPTSVRLSVEPRQIVMRAVGGVRTGTVQFTVRNAGAATAPLVGIELELPPSFQPAGSGWTGCTTGSPGHFSCAVKNLAGGGSVDLSLDVLGPNSATESGPAQVTVSSQSAEVFDESAAEPVPLNLLFP
jgi:hypothetical protein